MFFVQTELIHGNYDTCGTHFPQLVDPSLLYRSQDAYSLHKNSVQTFTQWMITPFFFCMFSRSNARKENALSITCSHFTARGFILARFNVVHSYIQVTLPSQNSLTVDKMMHWLLFVGWTINVLLLFMTNFKFIMISTLHMYRLQVGR